MKNTKKVTNLTWISVCGCFALFSKVVMLEVEYNVKIIAQKQIGPNYTDLTGTGLKPAKLEHVIPTQ